MRFCFSFCFVFVFLAVYLSLSFVLFFGWPDNIADIPSRNVFQLWDFSPLPSSEALIKKVFKDAESAFGVREGGTG